MLNAYKNRIIKIKREIDGKILILIVLTTTIDKKVIKNLNIR